MAKITRSIVLITTLVFLSVSAYGQATRTWVSGVGDDANPCSRTAPCKTFAGAISKTAAGGEINAIDPGGFGAVTITKSIRIDGRGVEASILASLTNGIIINAGNTDRIELSNIQINGVGNGLNGIRILNAGKVTIDNVEITNFSTRGIDINTAVTVPVQVHNSRILNCNTGIFATSGAVTTIHLTVNKTLITGHSAAGLNLSRSILEMRDSVITNSAVAVDLAGGSIALLHNNALTINTTGIRVNGGALVRMQDNQIEQNPTAGFNIISGTIESYGNNRIRGNGANVGALTDVSASLD